MDLDRCFEFRVKDNLFGFLERYLEEQPQAKNAKITIKGANRLIDSLLRETKSGQLANVLVLLSLIQALAQSSKLQQFLSGKHIKLLASSCTWLVNIPGTGRKKALNEFCCAIQEICNEPKMKSLIGKELLSQLVALMKESDSSTKTIAVDTINILVEKCPENQELLKRELKVLSTERNLLVSQLLNAEDYPFQAIIFEIIFRLYRKESESNLERLFGSSTLVASFREIQIDKWSEGIRSFLLRLNRSKKRIISLRVNSITVGDEEHTGGAWIDFGVQAMSFNIGEDEFLVFIPYDAIRRIEVTEDSMEFFLRKLAVPLENPLPALSFKVFFTSEEVALVNEVIDHLKEAKAKKNQRAKENTVTPSKEEKRPVTRKVSQAVLPLPRHVSPELEQPPPTVAPTSPEVPTPLTSTVPRRRKEDVGWNAEVRKRNLSQTTKELASQLKKMKTLHEKYHTPVLDVLKNLDLILVDLIEQQSDLVDNFHQLATDKDEQKNKKKSR